MNNISVEKVVKSADSSFHATYFEHEYFTAPLHIHPEYELILIEKGEGHTFVGDMVYKMKNGDFMLIGKNLPHLWLSADEYYEKRPSLRSASVYCQFDENIFPANDAAQEFIPIRRMLAESRKGICFNKGKTPQHLATKFRELPCLKGFQKLIRLYEILYGLALIPFKCLTTDSYINTYKSEEQNSVIQRTNAYIHRSYQENLTLEKIADHVGMNPSALCRYYKKHTGRTIFAYLSELRISYASKLLINKHISISQIAYDCGYNNISHFNRQFKSLIGKTPTEYCNHLQHLPEGQNF